MRSEKRKEHELAESDEFDPIAIAEKAIANNLDSVVFDKIDDRHIKRAPNWFEFCTGSEFLGLKPGPYARQVQMATKFFGDYCPRCSKPGFIDQIQVNDKYSDIREHLVFMQHGVCPKCRTTQLEFHRSGELPDYDQFICVAGQRAGKSTLTGTLLCYHLHRFLTLQKPALLYGLMESSTLHFTAVGLTAGTVQDNLWDPWVLGVIENSPWFRQYHAFLDATCKKAGIKPVYSLKDTYITYTHKGLVASYSGADYRKLRGKTRVFTCIEELGWFDANADDAGVKTNAKGQHDALANSLYTVRAASKKLQTDGKNWLPTGIDCNVSSPASKQDMIMRLLKEDRKKSSQWHFATWDVNPNMPYDALKHEEETNKRSFDRDFRAQPPMADSAFMDDEQLVVSCVQKDRSNVLLWETLREPDPTDPKMSSMWLKASARIRDKEIPRILTIDPGQDKNSFALTLLSWKQDLQQVSVDGVLECMPEKYADGSVCRVNFPKMYNDTINAILDAYNVKMVISDHWQSSDMLQRIKNERRIKTDAYTMRFEDFIAIRSAWYSGRVKLPALERSYEDLLKTNEDLQHFVAGKPVLKLLVQAMTVREVGRKVEKPTTGSDDIWRAFCLGATFLLDPETNRSFIYSGGGDNASRDRKMVGIKKPWRSDTSSSATYAVSASGRALGARKSRIDPTGIVKPPSRKQR